MHALLQPLCAAALVMATYGCGGDVVVDDSGALAAAAGAGGSSSSSTSASTGTGTSECDDLSESLGSLYEAATECAPADPSVHCMAKVEGFCCQVYVEDASSPATLAFLDLLHRSRIECPEEWRNCPLSCPVTPPLTCVPDSSPAGGHCH